MRYWSLSAILGEALDRGAVEPGAVANRALELVDRDRHRLDDAHDVGELELDEANALGLRAFDLFDAGHRLVGCYHRSRLLTDCADRMTICGL
jgi:hypothetical protein